MGSNQPFRIERVTSRVLWPTRKLRDRIDALAREVHADVVFVDPMIPLGLLAPRACAPYVVIADGAEITGYRRLPVSKQAARRVLRGAAGIVAAGSYPAREAQRAAGRPLRGIVIPPGVDVARFRPVDEETRKLTRNRSGSIRTCHWCSACPGWYPARVSTS